MTKPRKATPHAVKVLDLLAGKTTSDTFYSSNLVPLMEEAGFNRNQLDSVLSSFRHRGFLKLVGRGEFKLTKDGVAFAKTRDQLQVVEYKARGKAGEEPEEQAPALNVSLEADSMLNNLTTVIQQNAEYRNLLLELHNIIGNALKLHSKE